MEIKDNGLLKRIVNSDAIIIGIVTLIGYISLLGFEAGYIGYFRIPIQLISFDVSQVLFLISKFVNILGIILIIVVMLTYVYSFETLKKINWIYIFLILLPLIGNIPIGYLNKNYTSMFFWFGYGFVSSIGIPYIFVFLNKVFKRLNRESVSDIYKRMYFIESEEVNPLKIRKKKKFDRTIIFIIFGYLFAIMNILLTYGKYSAQENKDYLVSNTVPECVILHYIRQDTAICAPFDRNSKEVETSFRFINLQEEKGLVLKLESVGPLHLKPTPTKTPLPTQTKSPTLTPTAFPTITATP